MYHWRYDHFVFKFNFRKNIILIFNWHQMWLRQSKSYSEKNKSTFKCPFSKFRIKSYTCMFGNRLCLNFTENINYILKHTIYLVEVSIVNICTMWCKLLKITKQKYDNINFISYCRHDVLPWLKYIIQLKILIFKLKTNKQKIQTFAFLKKWENHFNMGRCGRIKLANFNYLWQEGSDGWIKCCRVFQDWCRDCC